MFWREWSNWTISAVKRTFHGSDQNSRAAENSGAYMNVPVPWAFEMEPRGRMWCQITARKQNGSEWQLTPTSTTAVAILFDIDRILTDLRTTFVSSFIHLFQTTEVHRHTHKTYNIYRKKEHKKRDRQKETKHTHKTRRTILLSQTDSLLAKLTLELCIKVLKTAWGVQDQIASL